MLTSTQLLFTKGFFLYRDYINRSFKTDISFIHQHIYDFSSKNGITKIGLDL